MLVTRVAVKSVQASFQNTWASAIPTQVRPACMHLLPTKDLSPFLSASQAFIRLSCLSIYLSRLCRNLGTILDKRVSAGLLSGVPIRPSQAPGGVSNTESAGQPWAKFECGRI